MKGSDRQAAKAWAINIAIQGTEKPERFDRETLHARILITRARNSIDRGTGTSRLLTLWECAIDSSRFSTKKLRDTHGDDIWRARACSLSLYEQRCGVFPYSVHYPRPKYEQDRGTSPPVGDIFLELVSPVLSCPSAPDSGIRKS